MSGRQCKDPPRVWNEELFRVLEGFPDLGHDDEVDACSRALELLNPTLKDWGFMQYMDKRVRQMRERQEQQKPQPAKVNYSIGSVEWQREN